MNGSDKMMVGMLIGMGIMVFSVVLSVWITGINNVITDDWKCTQYSLIGKPNTRIETCTQYSYQSQKE
jgi:hypothetical protein